MSEEDELRAEIKEVWDALEEVRVERSALVSSRDLRESARPHKARLAWVYCAFAERRR